MLTAERKKLSKGIKPFGKRLSTGEENRRFKGTLATNTVQQAWSNQSGRLTK